ncbi:hypothetical protein [Ralstonia sp. ASV6]|uniref:hypothetical protein n=1 Tax=Ralstonia sp. ASV6 TaxID=2795124 RepID=UPI0018EDDECA|nr:hypothetical protein [Ralstonia sp. ASV6]
MRRLGVFLIAVSLSFNANAQAAVAQIQSLITSIGVWTKQMSASVRQEQDAMMQAQQAYSSNQVQIFMRDQMRETVEQFGSAGQLVDGCYQVAMASQMGKTVDSTDTRAMSAMARLYTVSDGGRASSGGVAGALGLSTQVTQFPYAASVASRVARHASNYCTVAEAQLGYCTLNANGMQGGDQDFSLHLQPGKTYGWDQTEAAADFVKRIAPVRPVADSTRCSTPECIAAMRQRRESEAYMSMARYSLMKFTEAHSTQLGRTGSAQ